MDNTPSKKRYPYDTTCRQFLKGKLCVGPDSRQGFVFRRWQENLESAAHAELRLDINRTAVCFDDFLGDGQSQPDADIVRLPARFIAAIETLENVGQIFRADTGAIVLDFDDDDPVNLERPYDDFAAIGCVGQRIIQQETDGPPNFIGIALHRG